MYVLQRTSDGAFVARPGSASSYTLMLHKAQTYKTREEAEMHRCPENERILDVDDIMRMNS